MVYEPCNCASPPWALRAFIAVTIIAGVLLITLIVTLLLLLCHRTAADDLEATWTTPPEPYRARSPKTFAAPTSPATSPRRMASGRRTPSHPYDVRM